jgi:hypothetical protein
VRQIALLLFLLVVVDPYESIDYENINVYIIDEEPSYRIKVYGPEKNKNETEFSEEETQRFIKKVDSIINYSPYVFE